MEWLVVIFVIVAFVAGVIVERVGHKEKPIGTLRIDQSDPDDNPYLFLELETSPDVLKQRKTVMLKVNVENYISQK